MKKIITIVGIIIVTVLVLVVLFYRSSSQEKNNPKTVQDVAVKTITALSDKDSKKLAELIHPTIGVRFSPYAFVNKDKDVVLSKEEIGNFFSDSKTYLWGYTDGKGNPIELTPGEYYTKYIYSVDYKNAPKISFNKALGSGNTSDNITEVYASAQFVEYYFPGFNKKYEGMDWKSLRLVFQQVEGKWYLVGVVHAQWTI